MNLRSKQTIDYYLGNFLIFFIRPVMMLLSFFPKKNGAIAPRKIVVLKLVGGGSLVIALPSLLAIRKRYPTCRIELVCLASVKSFAVMLGIFDEIHVVESRSTSTLIVSLIRAWSRGLGADTVIDLEVYSRLSTIFSLFLFARERIGFYLQNRFWRTHLLTRLVFFNRYAGAWVFYDQIAALLDAPIPTMSETAAVVRARVPVSPFPTGPLRRIVIGHACSEFGMERILDPEQWSAVISKRANANPVEFVFLGVLADRPLADAIIAAARKNPPQHTFINHCGSFALPESIAVIWSAAEFWGIDSGLLHLARLGCRQCLSFWGPTAPDTRLRPIPGLNEEVVYRKISCSPCIHVADEAPCGGNNQCIKRLFAPDTTNDDLSFLLRTSVARPIHFGPEPKKNGQ